MQTLLVSITIALIILVAVCVVGAFMAPYSHKCEWSSYTGYNGCKECEAGEVMCGNCGEPRSKCMPTPTVTIELTEDRLGWFKSIEQFLLDKKRPGWADFIAEVILLTPPRMVEPKEFGAVVKGEFLWDLDKPDTLANRRKGRFVKVSDQWFLEDSPTRRSMSFGRIINPTRVEGKE